jgi:hypothetical protein
LKWPDSSGKYAGNLGNAQLIFPREAATHTHWGECVKLNILQIPVYPKIGNLKKFKLTVKLVSKKIRKNYLFSTEKCNINYRDAPDIRPAGYPAG